MFHGIRRLTTTQLPRAICRWNKKGLIDPFRAPELQNEKTNTLEKIQPYENAEKEEEELYEWNENVKYNYDIEEEKWVK